MSRNGLSERTGVILITATLFLHAQPMAIAAPNDTNGVRPSLPVIKGPTTTLADFSGSTCMSRLSAAFEALNSKGGGRLVVPSSITCVIDQPHATPLVQTSDIEVDFEEGAEVVAGPTQNDSILRIVDCDPNQDYRKACIEGSRPGHEHTFILRNYSCDASRGVPVTQGRQGNTCLSLQGQMRAFIIKPRLYGGRAYIHAVGGNGIDTVSVSKTLLVDPSITGFDIGLYPNDNNVNGSVGPFPLENTEEFVVVGGIFRQLNTVAAAKRQLGLLDMEGFLAEDCRSGVGTYWVEPLGTRQGYEPPAHRVNIEGTFKRIGYHAIDLHAYTTGRVNVKIEDWGRLEDGTLINGSEAINLAGTGPIDLSETIITMNDYDRFHTGRGETGVTIQNETEKGVGTVSGGGVTGHPTISGVDVGIYEADGVGSPSHLINTRINAPTPIRISNAMTEVDYYGSAGIVHTKGGHVLDGAR